MLKTPERVAKALQFLTHGYALDPEKILNQLILDMKEQLIEAKKQVAVSIADEKRLKKQLEVAEARVGAAKGATVEAERARTEPKAPAPLHRFGIPLPRERGRVGAKPC